MLWTSVKKLKKNAPSVSFELLPNFITEKGNLISEARRKMKAEYEKKLADYAVQKKIDRSAALNKTKIRKMAERNKLMENIKAEAAEKLTAILTSDKAKYKDLMKRLILQVSAIP